MKKKIEHVDWKFEQSTTSNYTEYKKIGIEQKPLDLEWLVETNVVEAQKDILAKVQLAMHEKMEAEAVAAFKHSASFTLTTQIGIEDFAAEVAALPHLFNPGIKDIFGQAGDVLFRAMADDSKRLLRIRAYYKQRMRAADITYESLYEMKTGLADYLRHVCVELRAVLLHEDHMAHVLALQTQQLQYAPEHEVHAISSHSVMPSTFGLPDYVAVTPSKRVRQAPATVVPPPLPAVQPTITKRRISLD